MGQVGEMQAGNAREAFLLLLQRILEEGAEVDVRGSSTRELLSQRVVLQRPDERCIIIPRRGNDIFAAIAETMWVLAGRDDVAFLRHYLPRAPDFSDDGVVWRAAYGPRLRDWNGVDQLAQVHDLLTRDAMSRRAVISLYDPDRDFVESRDIPCNNWLHFFVRDGALHTNVAIRSNDLWWGFSGINTFEWSVLHEMLAHWLGVRMGPITYFVSSLHLYSKYYERASEVLGIERTAAPYTYPGGGVPFATEWAALAEVLHEWFAVEEELRSGGDWTRVTSIGDPLLRDFALMLSVHAGRRHGLRGAALDERVAAVRSPDLRSAAAENLVRTARSRSGVEQ